MQLTLPSIDCPGTQCQRPDRVGRTHELSAFQRRIVEQRMAVQQVERVDGRIPSAPCRPNMNVQHVGGWVGNEIRIGSDVVGKLQRAITNEYWAEGTTVQGVA